MTAIALLTPDDHQPDLSALSNEELIQRLTQCFEVTIEMMQNAADVLLILEERRVDISTIRNGMLKYVRRIAYKQLLPELLVRFYGRRTLLDRVITLLLPDQQKLTAGQHVKLLVYATDGTLTHRMVDPMDLRPEQIRQVFDGGTIRTESEQQAWLDHERVQARKPIPTAVGKMGIDKERGGIVVKGQFVPLCDLLSAVAVLKRQS